MDGWRTTVPGLVMCLSFTVLVTARLWGSESAVLSDRVSAVTLVLGFCAIAANTIRDPGGTGWFSHLLRIAGKVLKGAAFVAALVLGVMLLVRFVEISAEAGWVALALLAAVLVPAITIVIVLRGHRAAMDRLSSFGKKS